MWPAETRGLTGGQAAMAGGVWSLALR